jgi:type I restriction enzyme, S subunit
VSAETCSQAYVPFKETLWKGRFRVGKLDRSEYQAHGPLPIIDQGQGEVAGYTSRTELGYDGPLPVVVFGDHTRVFKYVDRPFVAGADGTKVLVPDPEKLDALFYFFALRALDLPSRGYNRHYALLCEQSIPLPSLDEQQRIARILSTIQRAKRSGTHILDRTQAVRLAMTATLFDTTWPQRPIGSMAKVGNGSTPKRDDSRYWDGGAIPWLTSAKIHEGHIHFADQFVTATAVQECHLPMVPAGSVLIAITGQGKTLGNSALLAIDSCVSQHLAYIKLTSPDILPAFLHYYLSTRYEGLRSVALGGGSTKGALTCGFLSGYPVPVPPIAEQQLVVDALDSVVKKLYTETSALRALDSLHASAIDSLMGSAS